MSRAARLASVDRTTLYRLLERHGFRRELGEPVALGQLGDEAATDADTSFPQSTTDPGSDREESAERR